MERVCVPYLSGFVIYGGLIAGIITALFVFTAETTTGSITASETNVSEDGNILYRPTFRFSVNERDYTITPRSFVSPSPGDVGDPVVVLFDPRNPSNACIDRFSYTWGFAVMLTAIGVFIAVSHYTFWFVVRFFSRLDSLITHRDAKQPNGEFKS